MKLSIVVPCYNEEKNLSILFERFSKVITRDDIEVIFVENGSKDNSLKILEALIKEYKFARIVQVEENKGYGFGILSGMKEAKGEYLGWTHADLQTDPGDIIKAMEIMNKYEKPEKVYIKGRRRNRPFFDIIFTLGMSFFESIFLGVRLIDINAQPNIFHHSFYDSWINPPFDFSLDLFAFYKARINKLNIIRFNVYFPKRINGQSSWNNGIKSKIKFIKRTLVYSINMKRSVHNGNHSS
ncbi:MAG: glycosyltransferase family 2 protein [Bacteroidota bacterium]|nr:glycosyltransferase family 2 protein [Bacteroidota bacterium]